MERAFPTSNRSRRLQQRRYEVGSERAASIHAFRLQRGTSVRCATAFSRAQQGWRAGRVPPQQPTFPTPREPSRSQAHFELGLANCIYKCRVIEWFKLISSDRRFRTRLRRKAFSVIVLFVCYCLIYYTFCFRYIKFKQKGRSDYRTLVT